MLISRRAFILGSLLPLALNVFPAAAQDSCGAESEIVALADYVLANRSKMPKLLSRRNGAISAYLKIHYQSLAPEQVETLVAPLALAKVDGARELLDSWRISVKGLEGMLADNPEAGKALVTPGAGFSMLRAAVLTGEIPLLFDKLAALPEQGRWRTELRLVEALIDIDDESALAIASEAQSRKLLATAAGLIATHADAKAWQTFIDSVTDTAQVESLKRQFSWFPAFRGLPAYPRPPATDTQGEIMRVLFHQTAMASARTPQRDYLSTYLNQSGDFAGVGAAATALNDLLRDGGSIDMETAWLVAFEALREASAAKDKLDAQLKSIPFSGTRFGGTNVRDAIDTMLAVESFKSAAAGGGAPPDMVEGASGDFVVQLPAWREAADAIGKGADLAPFRASGQRLAITANLLFAIGRQADLAKFLTGTVPNADSIRLAEIHAEALDRICAGHLNFPGQSLTMPDMPLFRFEPQT